MTKQERRSFITSGNPEVSTTKNYSKSLMEKFGEFRTSYNRIAYRLFAFWDESENSVVVATHGVIKKSDKIPKKEIGRANKLKIEYLKLKKS